MRIAFLCLAFSGALLAGCGSTKNQTVATDLDARAFQAKINQLSNELILDVRTPEEYNAGHLEGAQNIDWNAGNFEQAVSGLDRNRPVMVYCLAGGRSAEAAQALRKAGFKNVYEMQGGMRSWRQSGFPEAKAPVTAAAVEEAMTDAQPEMTKADYNKLIASDKAVLVDFYAEWCGPCKKMKPSLDELTRELSGKVKIVRLDADKQTTLSNELGVVGLPTLIFYKNGKEVWKEMGFMTKQQLQARLQ